MGLFDGVGSALTGQTDPATASTQWDAYLDRPGNRQALLQIGLNMMQPTAIGQTTGGHIAQAIGSGGEAVDRFEKSELSDKLANAKIEQVDAKLAMSQQMNDIRGRALELKAAQGTRRAVGGLTNLFLAKQAQDEKNKYERSLDDAADAEMKQYNADKLMDPNSDRVKKYTGKSYGEIREMQRATVRRGSGGGAVVGDDSEAPVSADLPAKTSALPPGAKKAADGNYYVPDPNRPGKYLKVN